MRKTSIISLVEHIRKKMVRATNDKIINYQNRELMLLSSSFINYNMNHTLKSGRKSRITPASEVFFEVEAITKL